MNQINDIDPDLNFTNDAECSYFTSQNIHNILNNNMLNIIHVNIRSCHKNLDEFILLLGNIRVYFSVLILSATKFQRCCCFYIPVSSLFFYSC